MTDAQKDILLHVTGLDRSATSTRNHFATSEGSSEWADLQALVGAGMLSAPVHGGSMYGGMWFFYVTPIGLACAERIRAATTR